MRQHSSAKKLPRNFNKGLVAGFTYLGLLILLAIMAIVSAVALQIGVVIHRRVAEESLLNVGTEFSLALENYRRVTPAGQPDEPQTLQDLLRDPRFPEVVRHLRKIYADPITGQQEWGIQRSEESKRILGVFSLSDAKPIKIANFDLRFQDFTGKSSYREWVFTSALAGTLSAGGITYTDPRDLMGESPASSATKPVSNPASNPTPNPASNPTPNPAPAPAGAPNFVNPMGEPPASPAIETNPAPPPPGPPIYVSPRDLMD